MYIKKGIIVDTQLKETFKRFEILVSFIESHS